MAGDLTLPEDTPERIREWTKTEEIIEGEGKELTGELSAAMRADGHDPTPIRRARLGGG
jgi:hypothetical protein